ncbi:MAG TPA: hypothetical protein P5142_00215 [Spirochaetia bacterium]|nr:hypothetical protein [Spirochaetia bacterium]
MKPEEKNAIREALELGREYASKALSDHDAAYKRHPATEAERQDIVEDIAQIDAALASTPETRALQGAAQGLLTLMDEVPIDPSLGDETDRVFSRAEFAELRAALCPRLPCGLGLGDCSASIPSACDGCGNNPEVGKEPTIPIPEPEAKPEPDKWDLIAREIYDMVCHGPGAEPAYLAEVLRRELGKDC